MAVEPGKSGYEGEKDLAAQKEIYAAFLALMMELIKAIPGFSIPELNSGINVQRNQNQGLTIERKPKGQTENIIEVEQKPTPEIPKSEPARKTGIETLYGGGQNNLTPNDIKAIAGIIASKKGDTVIGGESLIIKFNGQTLFETDESGKISFHTAVSPEIKERFAALEAGKPNAIPLPANSVSNEVNNTHKAQSKLQDFVGNAFANVVNNLPAIGVPKDSKAQQASSTSEAAAPKAANNIVLPPNFTEGKRATDLEAPDNIVVEPGQTEALDIPIVEAPLLENEGISAKATEMDIGDEALPEEAIESNLEPLATLQSIEPVVQKKSMLNNVGDYIVDRAKKDTQIVANAATQMASSIGTNVATNLAQGFQAIPDAINNQYRAVKSRLTDNVMPEQDPRLEASIGNYMDQVGDMFDELQQDDPNLGLSASRVIDEQESVVPEFSSSIAPVTEEVSEQVEQSPEVIEIPEFRGLSTTVEVSESELPEISKPAKLKPVSIEDALSYMARRDDGAKAQDGRGYNLNDTGIGKQLTTQLSNGKPLDKAQAKDAFAMLKKYHKQFAEGGIKLPTWKSVQTQYSEPAYSATDQRAIFTRQQEKLDATMPIEQQQAVLKAVYKVHTLNMPEQNNPVQAGRYELELPIGSKLVNELDDLGVNNLSIEKYGQRILLGGVTMPGDYMPASTLTNAMHELRELRTFLSPDLKLSSEPVNAIPLTQPLPIERNDTTKTIEPATDSEEQPYTIKPEMKIVPTKVAATPEIAKAPAISRGGR